MESFAIIPQILLTLGTVTPSPSRSSRAVLLVAAAYERIGY